jgi:Ca-activated chloride channel family protein
VQPAAGLGALVMEALADFHFMRPLWLIAIIPAALLYWRTWRQLHSGQGWHGTIADDLLPHMLTGGTKSSRPGPMLALGVAWLLASLAMAGPSWEKLPQPVQRKEDALVILLDQSLSMLAEDTSPSRLIRSRQKLLDLLDSRKEGTTALVAYAGDAHVVSPLTDDRRTIANLLPALDPQIMPIAGSEPGIAVEQAVELLRDAGLERGRILLVTDGVREADRDRISRQLKGTHYRLSVLGVGTRDGSPIPLAGGYLKNSDGDIVIPSLKRGPLRQLAADNGGSYSDLTLDGSDLDRLLKDSDLETIENSAEGGRSVDRWQDMGFLLLFLLLPLALGSFRRGWLLTALLLLSVPEQAVALEWADLWRNQDQRAMQLLEQGDAAAAAREFKNPDWSAAASYRAGEYENALQHYRQGTDAEGWYNRGNSLAKNGDLPAAIKAYEEALAQQPAMEDAAFNKQLVEQLQQQQQEQKEQDQQNQDQQNQDQQNQDQQNQDQQNQDQQNQDQQNQDQQNQDRQNQDQQNQDQQNQDQQNQDQQDQEQENQQQQDREQREQEQQNQQQQAAETRTQEEIERDLANEQWLRRIPDDPAGLLRRKFRYESQQRSGDRRDSDENSW